MSDFLKSDKGILLLIILIFLISLPFFYLHQGLLLIDTGREYYLAQQSAHGGVLYKDILNIHGPFAYQLNALLFIIFGEKINVPYIAGILNSFVIIVTLFLLSREFLKKSLSALITILTMFSLVFTTFLFNSNITYSFCLIYALSSLLLSMLFLTKYLKHEGLKYAYIASFFAGLCISNKYEFILYPVILVLVFLLIKPLNFKQNIKALAAFLIVPVICFSLLFIKGLTLGDFKNAVETMITLATSENIKLFYSNFGNTFFNTSNYINAVLKNKALAIIGFLPIINIILFLSQIKSIFKNKPMFVFCIASIVSSVKFILFMNVEHMGAFLFPLCILTTLVLTEQFKKINQFKYIFLICLILVFLCRDFESLKYKNYKLETAKGTIYTFIRDGKIIKQVSDYLIKNSNKTDKVLVLPEGAIINFLTDRKSDNLYHNLVPLYYKDTFGDERVLKHFRENPADYYVILPINTLEYGYTDFCSYAINFCEMIEENYELAEYKSGIKIYKRKNK